MPSPEVTVCSTCLPSGRGGTPLDASDGPVRSADRDRWIDLLRALALVRVVVYHSFSLAWLPLVFPSLPVMFALAGSLVAGSLDRSGVNPWPVTGRRLRRLPPPVWALGVVAVPLMLWMGWTWDAARGLGEPLDWRTLALWVVPVAEPAGSAWGHDWSEPLWYLATYLWLLLLRAGPPAGPDPRERRQQAPGTEPV